MAAVGARLSFHLAKPDNLSYITLTCGPERESVSRKGTKCQGRPRGRPLVYPAAVHAVKSSLPFGFQLTA